MSVQFEKFHMFVFPQKKEKIKVVQQIKCYFTFRYCLVIVVNGTALKKQQKKNFI